MTQERVLEQETLEPLDFFVVDEFYKLQPRMEDPERSLLLNEAFYKLYKTGAQFYLLGPNIRGLDTGVVKRVKFQFIKTDYKTVASEIHHIKTGTDDEAALVALCSTLKDPTLIYCSSPARVRKVANALSRSKKGRLNYEVPSSGSALSTLPIGYSARLSRVESECITEDCLALFRSSS